MLKRMHLDFKPNNWYNHLDMLWPLYLCISVTYIWPTQRRYLRVGSMSYSISILFAIRAFFLLPREARLLEPFVDEYGFKRVAPFFALHCIEHLTRLMRRVLSI